MGTATRPRGPILITDLDEQRKAGISYPATVDQWRALYRQRARYELDAAFVRVGRRLAVLPDVYIAVMHARARRLA